MRKYIYTLIAIIPLLTQAQNGVLYTTSPTQVYLKPGDSSQYTTLKKFRDSLTVTGVAGLSTTINSLSTSIAGKPTQADLALKANYPDVSDSVLRNTGWAPTMADLKMWKTAPNKVVLMVGKTTIGDNLGGFYRYDVDSSGSDDLVYLNKIASNVNTVGRWVRIFVRAKPITGNNSVLVNNGGVKTVYVSATTDANGEAIVYLTDNGLSTGNALFTEIWSITCTATTDASGPATAVQSYRKSLSANLKTLTYGFYKANAFTVVLAALVTPVANVGAGVVSQFAITGINTGG